jgi:uncharacterized membrane protein
MSGLLGNWIFIACLSACCIACRQVFIKRFCTTTPSDILVFWTRLTGILALAPILFLSHTTHTIRHPLPFFTILIITTGITAIGGVLQISVLQKEPVTTSIPYQSLTPLFMIPFAIIILHQAPTSISLIGIILACIGAFVLNAKQGGSPMVAIRSFLTNKAAIIMTTVAAAFGLTTVLDRVAIESADALLYSLYFSIISSTIMGVYVLRKPWRDILAYGIKPATVIQGTLWILGFYAQMAAVSLANNVSSGVTYVKMLTLFSVLLTVVGGGSFFKEQKILKSAIASALMIAGAVLALWAR